MSDFDRFQQEVINAYLEKKEKHLLPIELERAAPTQLMNYCLTLFYRGELADDLPTLNRIFNPLTKYPDLETGIQEFGAVGFRSLRNFMIGRTTRPREPIVKLLAVLIDFQPRPYDKWVRERNGNKGGNVDGKADEENTNEEPPKDNLAQSGIKDSAQEGDNEHKETPPSEEQTIKPSILSRLKKSALYGTIAFAGMAGAYQISDSFDRECMYWKTDRYVPIACNEKIEDAEIIPLDKELVKNFRKIMSPDTLTLKSVGKVWYAKPTQDSAEFYTTKGVYPMDKGKALKPATEYIIKKYILDRYK
ncbi:hypothetical protein ACFQRK_12075 [Parapedobacter sp. GCM10030251]|uniref:hypothetical protein n=1 Tax=Parapedobacter sp. GCM10030251 TaxID=3273419 RepID=UPI003620A3BC